MIDKIIKTDRLSLRPYVRDDIARLVARLNNLEVTKYLEVVDHPYTVAGAEWFLGKDRAGEMGQNWAIDAGDGFIGMVGFIDGGLGFWLAQDEWGKGYMTEAVTAVITTIFAQTDIQELDSGYFLGNEGSKQVHNKLGFRKGALAPTHCKATGETVTIQNLTLTRDDFRRR